MYATNLFKLIARVQNDRREEQVEEQRVLECLCRVRRQSAVELGV